MKYLFSLQLLLFLAFTVHSFFAEAHLHFFIDVGSVSARQRHNTESSKQIFPGKESRSLSPYFHIHVSVNDLYIHTIGLPICGRSWKYINRSQTNECGNRDWRRAIPYLGKHKWDFCWSAGFSAEIRNRACLTAFYSAQSSELPAKQYKGIFCCDFLV